MKVTTRNTQAKLIELLADQAERLGGELVVDYGAANVGTFLLQRTKTLETVWRRAFNFQPTYAEFVAMTLGSTTWPRLGGDHHAMDRVADALKREMAEAWQAARTDGRR